jgi:beta-1,4-mannooligosaccharide/beta-1,4-mannosyl-N-acetylglucosamine phosphorylase
MKELLRRHPGNPVLRPEDIPGRANCVFNSGAIVHGDEIVMLVNTWASDWTPQFLVGRSRDGIRFALADHSLVQPPREYPYVPHEGIFDTRITPLEGWYYITYNVATRLGGRIMLARTRDFSEIETLDFITSPDHRNCVLFPERIGGQYVRLERPNVNDAGDIYISYSPDLIHWGRTRLLLERNTRYWESAKVGPGAPPVRTDQGWLCIYHGCRQSMNGFAYHAGAVLLDLENPARIIGKLRDCLMWPQEQYERVGNVNNVVFPTAALLHGGPDELKVYYGAADTCIGLATGSLRELVEACLADGPLPERA